MSYGMAAALLAGVIWVSCGAAALRLDRSDFPQKVDPIGDVLLSTALLCGGPFGLAAVWFMRLPKAPQ